MKINYERKIQVLTYEHKIKLLEVQNESRVKQLEMEKEMAQKDITIQTLRHENELMKIKSGKPELSTATEKNQKLKNNLQQIENALEIKLTVLEKQVEAKNVELTGKVNEVEKRMTQIENSSKTLQKEVQLFKDQNERLKMMELEKPEKKKEAVYNMSEMDTLIWVRGNFFETNDTD